MLELLSDPALPDSVSSMQTKNATLGRLEPVELRKAWANEASDFTPWLADEENIRLLGDTIGMDLEVAAQEKNVGPFRADILCKETVSDRWVLVENQLERTDHSHLGQLITYAAGLDTATIVWIADRFTDEHRAAMDWLNEVTGEEIAFFGLEVELWRIGDSAIAPKFNIVSSPNDWTKRLVQGAKNAQKLSLTPAKEMQIEFWSGFREFIESAGATFRPTKSLPQHWMSISIGRVGFRLNAIASLWDSQSENFDSHEIRAELELYDDSAKDYYAQLEGAKAQLESELGEPLIWYNPDNKKLCRIYLRQAADLNDRDSWRSYYEWLKKTLESLQQVFAPRIKLLDATPPVTSPD